MSTALLPLCYFGNIEYFSLLLKYSEVHLEACEHFPKQTLRNRCVIYGANGPIKLSVPVVRKSGEKQLMKDIGIRNVEAWQHDHWQSIVSAYNRSPFFEYYADTLAPFFEKEWSSLMALNEASLEWALEHLQVPIKLELTTSYSTSELDYRGNFSGKQAPTNPAIVNNQYLQVFSEKHGFRPNLSILDLLFNEGPNSAAYLQLLTQH